MGDLSNITVTMAVDTKKYGIRIHKALFRQLGEPKHIQLLVNPNEGAAAIQTIEKEMSGGQSHRIVEKRMHSERSYEIYSRLIIRDLVESYGLTLGPRKAPCIICAVSTIEQIYQKYGYHVLSRVLRLCIGTWEGDMNSFSANILNGITKLISVFGDQLNDETFKEKVGAISVKQLVRTAKERHAGSMGYAEAMLIEYNGRKKNSAQRLSINKLHTRESSVFSGLEDGTNADAEDDWSSEDEIIDIGSL